MAKQRKKPARTTQRARRQRALKSIRLMELQNQYINENPDQDYPPIISQKKPKKSPINHKNNATGKLSFPEEILISKLETFELEVEGMVSFFLGLINTKYLNIT